jgi:FkbM family methyltransferase
MCPGGNKKLMAIRQAKLLCKRMAWKVLPQPVIQFIKKRHYAGLLRHRSLEKEPDLKVVQCLIKPGDYVIDIGANIGVYTKAISELVGPKGRVYSIEPFPATFQILCSNIKKLSLENVEPMNFAISDHRGVVTMELPCDPSGAETHYRAHIVSNNAVKNKTEIAKVQATTIDSRFLNVSTKITFIKCDVEGHELTCLKGAQKLLAQSRPAWLIEVSGEPDDVSSSACDVFELLSKTGYTAWWFDGVQIRKRAVGDKSANYFFLTNTHINFLKGQENTPVLI